MLSKWICAFAFAFLQAGLATAGNAIVSNRCPYDIWIWSVDQSGSSAAIHIPARTIHSEPFRSTCQGCGTSIKVSKSNQLLAGQHTQFEYSIVNNQIWYDLSFINCASGQNANNCPGHDMGLAMNSPQPACGSINCPAGSYCPTQAYYVDQPGAKLGLPDPVFTCPGVGTGMDLYMQVCSGQASLKRSIAGRLSFGLDG